MTVDHGLQPGSDEQARRVVDFGRSLGLDPVDALRVEVGRTGGPEGAARDARYTALAAHCELSASRRAAAGLGADNSGRCAVLLGHTRDDQAETVLLGLGRGSGPRSIGGMRVCDGVWRRPFLVLDRATTVAACAAQGLPTWDDPMNADPRFVRVRLRREVLPLLEDVLHGGVAASLARTAELLRDDLEALDAWADGVLAAASTGSEVDARALVELPRAVRTRVVRRWAAAAGSGPLTAEHTAALDALVSAWRGQGPVAVPGGAVARRPSGTLGFVPHAQDPHPQE